MKAHDRIGTAVLSQSSSSRNVFDKTLSNKGLSHVMSTRLWDYGTLIAFVALDPFSLMNPL